jgi:hypothetical protein
MKAPLFSTLLILFMLMIGETACATDLSPNLIVPTPSIGRLFLAPNERDQLDARRKAEGSGPLDSATIPDTPQNPIIADDDSSKGFLLSGVLFCADGKTTIWINGKSELSPDKPTVNIINAEANRNAMEILLQKDKQKMFMKPGQVWLPAEGKVVEYYNVNSKATFNNGSAQ